MNKNKDIIAKIKKLLSLSKSNNPNESSVALKNAIKLSRRHDIDMNKIMGPDVFCDISETEILAKYRIYKWEHQLSSSLCKFFGCASLSGYAFGQHKRAIIIAGNEADKEIVVCLFVYLMRFFIWF